MNLILPKKVTIRLVDNRKQPVPIANVILGVHLFASRKNDFYLGPYVSNADGIVVITKERETEGSGLQNTDSEKGNRRVRSTEHRFCDLQSDGVKPTHFTLSRV